MAPPILQNLFTSMPMMLVAVACAVVAVVQWRRAPVSSLLVVLACGTSLALLLAYPFAYNAAVHLFANEDRIKVVFAFAWSFARAIYLILLVIAVYAGRSQHVQSTA